MTQASSDARDGLLARCLTGLQPSYFALVMATGIVSIACWLLHVVWIALALFVLDVAFYAVLVVLTVARVALYPASVAADFRHHGRSVGFFTIVAATSVLGSECFLVGDSFRAAFGLWCLAIALWAALTYAVFTVIIVKPEKPALAEGINGGWLVVVVAAQSVSVLGSQLAPSLGAHTPAVLFFSLALWLGGGMLYFWIISLIFYRYTFFVMSPSDLAPPYWINMGAAAISTLAGTLLVAAAQRSPVLTQILPFVQGFSLMWWATATWWIPMLLILGVWRHVYRRFPLRYDPLYWGAVFPLGMYTAATKRLSVAVDAPFLAHLASAFLYVALFAWCVAAIGMGAHLVAAVSRPKAEHAPG